MTEQEVMLYDEQRQEIKEYRYLCKTYKTIMYMLLVLYILSIGVLITVVQEKNAKCSMATQQYNNYINANHENYRGE